MANTAQPSQPVPPSSGMSPAQAAQAAKNAAVSGASGSSTFNGSTKISSISDLKSKDPKLYNLMMKGLALQVISQQNAANRKIKELNRKAREQAKEG